jgi:hypothetical protein
MDTPEGNAQKIARHRRDRLRALMERVRAEIPAIVVDGPLSGDGLMVTANARFPNGYEIILAVDHDFPDVFYEASRMIEPGEPTKFSFEGVQLAGSALTDHLILDGAVELACNYAALPPRPGFSQA